jgi:hypothetical protein
VVIVLVDFFIAPASKPSSAEVMTIYGVIGFVRLLAGKQCDGTEPVESC